MVPDARGNPICRHVEQQRERASPLRDCAAQALGIEESRNGRSALQFRPQGPYMKCQQTSEEGKDD